MKGQKGSLIVVGVIILALYLWAQSQNKTRGMATAKNQNTKSVGPPSWLKNLLGGKKPSGAGGGKAGGGSGAGSGAGTAGGAKMCNRAPDVSCCLAYAGKDSNGNEIYQKSDGSLVYSDGSPATQCDIACNEGACAGTVCTPPNCNPQDVSTAQPCCNPGVCGGCTGTGCFCAGGGCSAGCFCCSC